jgi:glyoxylase-like metal-dependent hydrolase (beta-lactamase superfamily II)
VRVIDVKHLGRPHVIGCWQVDDLLIDAGPESSLATLLEELGDEQPRALLLTHIHLDHAAATGALVRRWPELEVYVHERGAPHLIDPSKLLASAERLYGDRLNDLWGEILPVPEENVRTLSGGETVHGMRVAYTPGHASHHVSYFHEDSGTAFTGDATGQRIEGTDVIVPGAPPPDVDVEAWHRSIDAIEAWQPERLALTHFGAFEDASFHLTELRERLEYEAALVRDLDEEDFAQRFREDLRARTDEGTALALEQANPADFHWRGLRRYWDKKAEREAAA